MTSEPTIDQVEFGRLRDRVHGREQREHAGDPPPPPERNPGEPPPDDEDDPTQRKRPRVDPNDPH